MAEKENPGKKIDVRPQVRDRYGSIAAEFDGAGAAACCGPVESGCECSPVADPMYIDIVSKMYENPDVTSLPDDVIGLSLGCGDPVTLASLEPGQTVLDLGSGGGIDCFLAAKRVGETGRVIGIDMTAEMIERARVNKDNLGAENVEFRLGEIEHLPVANEIADVVISNCVINLSPDKEQVFREAFRALRPGGRLAVSDIVTDGPLPQEIKSDISAWAGCVAGALEVSDYVAAIEAAGFVDVELEPVYLDEAWMDVALEQLNKVEIKDSADAQGNLVFDGGEKKDVTPQETRYQSGKSIRQMIFSAKVTAVKPDSRDPSP